MESNLVKFADVGKVFVAAVRRNKRGKKKSCKTTEIEDSVWVSYLIPIPKREYKIYPQALRPGRTKIVPYRLDFAFPDYLVCVEIQGGIWTKGRHTRAVGYMEDRNRTNYLAGELGWIVLEYAPGNIDFHQIKRVLMRIKNERSGKVPV
jgi:very-short-patch-repair endonuclease